MTTSRPLQDRLTAAAFDLHRATLEADGTVLSQEHATALLKLMNTYSRFALDPKFTGRPCFGIPLGGGKSTSAACWIATAAKMGLFAGPDAISVSIATAKVDDICRQKRRLIDALHVDAKLIGLQHSYNHARGECLEPHTNGMPFPIMLCTHSRVRGKDGAKLFSHHEGKPRELMIFDEAFFPSSSLSVAAQSLYAGIGALDGHLWTRRGRVGAPAAFTENTATLETMLAFLVQARLEIVNALHAAPSSGADVDTIKDRHPGDDTIKEWLGCLNQKGVMVPALRETVAGFLEMCHEPLRVLVADGTQGLVTVRLEVDDALQRLVILDATSVIRDLPKMDPQSQTMGSEYQFAKYPDLHIHHHEVPAGRDAMERSFVGLKNDAGKYALEVRDIVLAEREADPKANILICTVKEKTVLIAKEIRQALASAGVNVEEKTADGKDRIAFLSYGQETGTNGLHHMTVVIAAGVMYRKSIDLAGQIKAARRDRAALTDQHTLYKVQESEIAHQLAQLAGRSAIRVIQEGKAGACSFHFMYEDKPGMKIQSRLEQAFPGCVYHAAAPLYGHIKPPTPLTERKKKESAKTSALAGRILDHIEPAKVSYDPLEDHLREITFKTSELAASLELAGPDGGPMTSAAKKLFSEAVKLVCASGKGWPRSGQKLVWGGPGQLGVMTP